MSSKRRLAILWNAGQPRERPGHHDLLDQLVGGADALPVAGEVVGQRHDPLAAHRGQHQLRLQREQGRRGVADRRAGAEVAAEGRAVADQPRGELREQLGQQRHLAVQPALDLGQGERGAEPDLLVASTRQPAQLGQPVDRDHQRRARTPRRLTSTPQSVEPATSTASGRSASSCERLGQVAPAGRARRRPRRAGPAAPRAAACVAAGGQRRRRPAAHRGRRPRP